ncbi:DUF4097 domain-containing protein [Roseivirga sp. BDSF3-8]|uniref:DUF4097 family beta strand repeat-containing protein n=1 Tax=Roseivirga sp. BDSF3-8 TaxID=3241598 RepID=UPI003531EC7B
MKISVITTALSLAFLWPVISQAQHTVDESFNGIKKVEVKGSYVDVEIVGTPKSNVHLTGELSVDEDDEDYKILHEVNGDKLEVWIERPNRMWSWNSSSGRSIIKLEVPVKTEIEVRNSSGNVNIAGIDEDVAADASSGNVDVKDVRGRLQVEASSGNIYLSDIEGPVNSKTSSGRQTLDEIKGDIEAEASSGSIRITEARGHMNLETSSGDIRLTEVKCRLKAQSTSGSIIGNEVDLEGDSEFKSTSGSIRIDLINDTEDIHFDLHATSGSLKAGSSEGKRDLVINSRGKVKVYGKTTSGSQKYY